MTRTFLSIGECMLELSQADDGPSDTGSSDTRLWRMGFAGDTLNTAWYARALLDPDAWRVAYFTRLGQDGFSARMRDFLAGNGIDTGWITTDPERRPGLYTIETRDGERSFTYWRDHSAARHLADDAPLLARAIDEADAVYLSGITLAILTHDRRRFLIEKFGEATAAGKITAFDPNIRPRLWPDQATLKSAIMEAAGAARIVLPSFDDERTAFGDASPRASAERYLQAGAAEIAVKNGDGAATLAWQGMVETVASRKAKAIVDTTGAGDSFNAGYLAARLEGASPVEAAGRGHALACMVVGHRGALMAMDEVKPALTANA